MGGRAGGSGRLDGAGDEGVGEDGRDGGGGGHGEGDASGDDMMERRERERKIDCVCLCLSLSLFLTLKNPDNLLLQIQMKLCSHQKISSTNTH